MKLRKYCVPAIDYATHFRFSVEDETALDDVVPQEEESVSQKVFEEGWKPRVVECWHGDKGYRGTCHGFASLGTELRHSQ